MMDFSAKSHPARRRAPRCCGIAAFVLLSLSAFAKDQVPDWVRAAANEPAPKVAASADAVILLEDVAYTVAPDGSLTEHYRKVLRVLRPQGRKYGDLFATYNSGAKLRFLHIWSIGADGHEYAVKDNEQTEVGTGAGFELYSDGRARGAKAPGMDVGAVAAMEYEQQVRPYDNDIVWIPGDEVPVARERLTLNLPPGSSYRASWKSRQKADAVDVEHGRTLWEVSGQPGRKALEHIPLAPDELSQASRLDIFYQGSNVAGQYGAMSGDWQSIGEWYERLAKGRNKPDPAITTKAQELVSGKTGFRDRTEAIASFVQSQIRYVAIEIGVGGYQPHTAAEIFHARYGDCKDKATLLSAMLDAVGIRSTWVMVDTRRGVVSSSAPSILGNHMIAAIQLPADYKPEGLYSTVATTSGKRFLIFDPTWEKTPFGHLERELQGSDALLVDGAQSQAIRLPVLSPEQNSVRRKESFQLSADGTLTGSVQISESGDAARDLRALFSEGSGKQRQEQLEHETAHDLREFMISDIQGEHASDLAKPFELRYTVKATNFAQTMGPLLTVRPRVSGREAFHVDTKRREVPIDLDRTQEVRDDVTIALPPGFDVDELPAEVNLDLGFAAYRSKTSVEDHALHYQRTYAVRDITLPAERYADVQTLARTIAADEQSSAVLKHK